MASAIQYRNSGVLLPPQQVALALSTMATCYAQASDPKFRDFGHRLFAEMLAFISMESLEHAVEAQQVFDPVQEPVLGQNPLPQNEALVLPPWTFDERPEITSQLPTPPNSSMPTPVGTGFTQTPISTPAATTVGKPTAASKGPLGEGDIISRGSRKVICKWLDCGQTMPAEGIAAHCRKHIDTSGQSTSMVQCLWEGCKKGQVQLRNFDRHITDTHNKGWSVTCSVCGTCKRTDSYKKSHGPARFCTRRPVAVVSAQSAHEAPVASTSFAAASTSGPGNLPPTLWTAPRMEFQPLPPAVPSYVGPIRSAPTHRQDRQDRQGVPYSMSSRPSWGILPP
ncbi:hypothetical protein C8Q73DRAFT_412205 [Cubamyces lactineus]|nr:hypothetical protein C8Q73DRAFT_412205 [Cubamyces lactineus]